MGEDGPVPGASRVVRQRNARAVQTLVRRGRWLTAVTLASLVLLLGVVAWYASWTLWPALVAILLIAVIYGRYMGALGWQMHEVDEHVRTMGGWEITGRTPSGDPVTMAGHMVHDQLADVGYLTRFIQVSLDADDY